MAFSRVTDQASLIQAIQTLRQFQSLPEPPDFQSRKTAFENLIGLLQQPGTRWLELISAELGVSLEIVRDIEFRSSADFLSDVSANETEDLPRGLITMISPQVFPIRLTLERLVPALLAGNTVLLKMSSKTPKTAEILLEILEKAGVHEKSLALATTEHSQLQPMLTGHPAIRGVSFVGRHSSASEISKAVDHVRSRLQAWTGGISAILVMDESYLESAAMVLENELSQWPYRSPMFPTKIFVLDKFLETARSVFSASVAHVQIKDSGERFQTVLAEMKKETARVLHEKAPALVENLPNCSELQQNELHTPIIQITSVKYINEMAKWVNNGFSGFRAVVFGDDEKARKLAGKLEVGAVSINKAFDPGQSLLFGVKESSIGETNPASFFYQRRQISDEKSKEISLLTS